MNVNKIERSEFLKLVYNDSESLMSRLEQPEVYIVKQFYEKKEILEWRNQAYQWGMSSEASWHPCLDGCPDYHRIHDNYPKAFVKAKMHAYYYHGYYEKNSKIFEFFSEIFDIKNHLAGEPKGSFLKNKPSDLIISRVNIHNYPCGGGYQAQHVDPISPFAKIQTIVQASEFGTDFNSGGVYACEERGGEKTYVDPHTEVGDLIIMSPKVVHGVDAVDETDELSWQRPDGRWMIMPIIIHSDYESEKNVKPKEVN